MALSKLQIQEWGFAAVSGFAALLHIVYMCVAWVHNAPCLLLSEELLLGLNVCALGRVRT